MNKQKYKISKMAPVKRHGIMLLCQCSHWRNSLKLAQNGTLLITQSWKLMVGHNICLYYEVVAAHQGFLFLLYCCCPWALHFLKRIRTITQPAETTLKVCPLTCETWTLQESRFNICNRMMALTLFPSKLSYSGSKALSVGRSQAKPVDERF